MDGSTKYSAQSYADDPRNENVLISVNGELVPRDQGCVSVFDAGFALGDGVWEGMRLINDKIFASSEHIDRLYAGALSIQLNIGLSKDEILREIYKTTEANDMHDGAHIRLAQSIEFNSGTSSGH